MRILFIGDVVGSLGREALATYVPKLKKKYRPQVTIANGENAASGRGITGKIYKKFCKMVSMLLRWVTIRGTTRISLNSLMMRRKWFVQRTFQKMCLVKEWFCESQSIGTSGD